MIWSVSTSARSSTATRPSITSIASISAPVPDVDEVAFDRRRRRHLRADQVRSPTGTLAALEVAVGGGGAALSRLENVRIHPEAGRAARLAPLEAGGAKDLIEALLFGLGLDLLGAGHDHAAQAPSDLPAVEQGGRLAQVGDPGVGARADEDPV